MTAPSENQMLDLVRVAIAEIESGGKVRFPFCFIIILFHIKFFFKFKPYFSVILFLHYYYYTYYSHVTDSRSLSCGVWKDGDRHRLYMLSK